MNRLSRGATVIKEQGLYKNIDPAIVMTVITRREITLLEYIIKKANPKTFIIINTVHEVLGEGFKRRS